MVFQESFPHPSFLRMLIPLPRIQLPLIMATTKMCPRRCCYESTTTYTPRPRFLWSAPSQWLRATDSSAGPSLQHSHHWCFWCMTLAQGLLQLKENFFRTATIWHYSTQTLSFPLSLDRCQTNIVVWGFSLPFSSFSIMTVSPVILLHAWSHLGNCFLEDQI